MSIKTSKTKTMLTTALVCAALQLSGCVSALDSMRTATQKAVSPKVSHSESDVIRQIGYPTHQGARQKGMVLLADQHSYLISTGDVLLEQLTQLNPESLNIQHPVQIQAYPDNTVTISLNFSYNVAGQSLNAPQKQLIDKLCHTATTPSNDTLNNVSAIHQCTLPLEGGMYRPVQPNTNAATQSTSANFYLQQGLPAQINYLKAKRAKTSAEIGVIPVSVVVDTLTIPLQLLIIGKAFDGL
ncbi:hypothetical protein [Psychrobacter sp. FDAARGOS_221]|uniref:hypothetical protein n=1 Tax=Psychrobacter sp. FDAARGOS_221 TaxID=1975705 RepID=UPI000BB58D71|nr:hypothetical protein [Psychrobacter sp. FDAARGOS_221]PNK59592.1 hypothetical protein A6J60_000965 [Psychrobacter sp. FDAARGOS_221]